MVVPDECLYVDQQTLKLQVNAGLPVMNLKRLDVVCPPHTPSLLRADFFFSEAREYCFLFVGKGLYLEFSAMRTEVGSAESRIREGKILRSF